MNEKPRREGPAGVDIISSASRETSLRGRREATRGAEIDRQDALILGRVDAGRASPDALRQRDLGAFEGGLDVEIQHLDRKPEAGHGIPVLLPGDGPVREARIAG